jgi:hypothetical protein
MAHVTASLNRLHENPLAVELNPRSRTSTPPDATTDAGTSGSEASASGTPDFQSLFNSQMNSQPAKAAAPTATPATTTPAPTSATSTATDPPTPESVFGASPWESNPTGTNPDGSTINFNPWYFATPQAAAQVAQMLGGTVVESNEMCGTGGPFTQAQPNLMVQMPNGNMINAGLIASFYAHGYPQSYINTLISNEIQGTSD